MTAKKVKDKAVKADAAKPVKKAAKKADKAAAAPKAIIPGSKKELRGQIDAALATAIAPMQQHFKEKDYAQLLKKAGKLFGDALQTGTAKAPAKAKSKIVVVKKKGKDAGAAKSATTPAE